MRRSTSQSASNNNYDVVAPNWLTSSRRPPEPSEVRAHAITVSRCTSKNAHRSTIVSMISLLSRLRHAGTDGGLVTKKLRYVLEATGRSTRDPRVKLTTGSATP